MKELLCAFCVMAWIGGIVLAKGFWATTAAVLIAPFGWYLVAERAMQAWGIV